MNTASAIDCWQKYCGSCWGLGWNIFFELMFIWVVRVASSVVVVAGGRSEKWISSFQKTIPCGISYLFMKKKRFLNEDIMRQRIVTQFDAFFFSSLAVLYAKHNPKATHYTRHHFHKVPLPKTWYLNSLLLLQAGSADFCTLPLTLWQNNRKVLQVFTKGRPLWTKFRNNNLTIFSYIKEHTHTEMTCVFVDVSGSAKPQDCVWGDWAPWTQCSVTCVSSTSSGTSSGVQRRNRKVKVNPGPGGIQCNIEDSIETIRCIAESPCPTTTGGNNSLTIFWASITTFVVKRFAMLYHQILSIFRKVNHTAHQQRKRLSISILRVVFHLRPAKLERGLVTRAQNMGFISKRPDRMWPR